MIVAYKTNDLHPKCRPSLRDGPFPEALLRAGLISENPVQADFVEDLYFGSSVKTLR